MKFFGFRKNKNTTLTESLLVQPNEQEEVISLPVREEKSKEYYISEQKLTQLMSERDQYGCTALHRAASSGDTEKVELLLEGLDPQHQAVLLADRDNSDWTPLHKASFFGNAEAIKVLFKNISPEQQVERLADRNNSGWTSLHQAAQSGHTTILKVMLEGLSPEQRAACLADRDDSGYTPLQYAAQSGHIETAKLLVDYGADTTARVNTGRINNLLHGAKGATPADLAGRNGYTALASFLQQAKNTTQDRNDIPNKWQAKLDAKSAATTTTPSTGRGG